LCVLREGFFTTPAAVERGCAVICAQAAARPALSPGLGPREVVSPQKRTISTASSRATGTDDDQRAAHHISTGDVTGSPGARVRTGPAR
jgi:hypothetical protein